MADKKNEPPNRSEEKALKDLNNDKYAQTSPNIRAELEKADKER